MSADLSALLPPKAGCVDPALGARATLRLGADPGAAVAAHLRRCAACRLERAAYLRLDADAAEPTTEQRARAAWLVRQAPR